MPKFTEANSELCAMSPKTLDLLDELINNDTGGYGAAHYEQALNAREILEMFSV